MAVNPEPTYITARKLIELALQDSGWVGLGQSAPQDTINKAFIRLNWLISYWATRRWFAYRVADLSFTSTGARSYSVGSGGDFNINSDFNADFNEDFGAGQPWGFRPVKVIGAYGRLLSASPGQPVDYNLIPILSMQDYAKLQLKFMTPFPTHFFYDPTSPRGTVYFWPIPPTGQWELHILVPQPVLTLATLDSYVFLPPEYQMVLELSLARWLRSAAKLPADPELNALLTSAVAGLKNNNARIANLQMPVGVIRSGRYNIYSDGLS